MRWVLRLGAAVVGFGVAVAWLPATALSVAAGVGDPEPTGTTTPVSAPPPVARRAMRTAAKATPSRPMNAPWRANGVDAMR